MKRRTHSPEISRGMFLSPRLEWERAWVVGSCRARLRPRLRPRLLQVAAAVEVAGVVRLPLPPILTLP